MMLISNYREGTPNEFSAVRCKDSVLILFMFFLLQFCVIAVGELFAGDTGFRAAISLFATIIAVAGVLAIGSRVAGEAFTDPDVHGVGLAPISKKNVVKYMFWGGLLGGQSLFLPTSGLMRFYQRSPQ